MRSEKLAAMLLPLMTLSASAHIMLAEPSALPGARYVAHFAVGHGCSGSPTTMLQVEIPPNVTAVAPETPPGWSLATVRTGGRITLVTWKGGNIPANKSTTFTIAMTLPAQPGMLVFPTTQTCEKGEVKWTDLPAAAGAPHPANAAPVLTVSPTKALAPAMPAGMKM